MTLKRTFLASLVAGCLAGSTALAQPPAPGSPDWERFRSIDTEGRYEDRSYDRDQDRDQRYQSERYQQDQYQQDRYREGQYSQQRFQQERYGQDQFQDQYPQPPRMSGQSMGGQSMDGSLNSYLAGKLILMNKHCIVLSREAARNAHSPQVKQFAQMTVEEHEKLMRELHNMVDGEFRHQLTSVDREGSRRQTSYFRGEPGTQQERADAERIRENQDAIESDNPPETPSAEDASDESSNRNTADDAAQNTEPAADQNAAQNAEQDASEQNPDQAEPQTPPMIQPNPPQANQADAAQADAAQANDEQANDEQASAEGNEEADDQGLEFQDSEDAEEFEDREYNQEEMGDEVDREQFRNYSNEASHSVRRPYSRESGERDEVQWEQERRGQDRWSEHSEQRYQSQSSGFVSRLVKMECDAAKQQIEMAKRMLREQSGQDYDMAFLGMTIGSHTHMIAHLDAMQDVDSRELSEVVREAKSMAEDHLAYAKHLAKQLEDREYESTDQVRGNQPGQVERSGDVRARTERRAGETQRRGVIERRSERQGAATIEAGTPGATGSTEVRSEPFGGTTQGADNRAQKQERDPDQNQD